VPEPTPPTGPVESLRFGGILEIVGGSRGSLESIVRILNGLDLVEAELDTDGGHHSLMFDNQPVPGKRASRERIDRLVELLQELVDASEEPAGAESTLNCTAVHSDGVVETLIGVKGGVVRPISRVRGRVPPPIDNLAEQRRMAWGRVLVAVVALAVGSSLLAWKYGYVDRVMAAAAEKMERDTGAFGDRLEFTAEREWGKYKILVKRGPGYPADPEQVAAQLAASKDLAARAVIKILSSGGTIYVQLLDKQGKVLGSSPVNLRPLLESADRTAKGELAGKLGATRFRLSLSEDDGEE